MQKLQLAYGEQKLQIALDKLTKYDLLILDDVDYTKKTDAETSFLFELIADRYEKKSLLIVVNQACEKWNSIFPSSEVAVAAIDRLIHHATIISFDERAIKKQHSSQIRKRKAYN